MIQLIITLIVLCAVIGIACVAIRASGVQIPQWVATIFWIVVVACVAIYAIRFLSGMATAAVVMDHIQTNAGLALMACGAWIAGVWR